MNSKRQLRPQSGQQPNNFKIYNQAVSSYSMDDPDVCFEEADELGPD
jgi:hypothetical protein